MKNEGTEKLIESVYQSVLECGEVATKEDVIGIAVELEQEEGIEFESSDIVIAFYEGNDAGIDAFVLQQLRKCFDVMADFGVVIEVCTVRTGPIKCITLDPDEGETGILSQSGK